MWHTPADTYAGTTNAYSGAYAGTTYAYSGAYAGTTHAYSSAYAGTTHAYSGAYCHTHGIPEPRPSGLYLDGLRYRVRPGHHVWRLNRGL